MTTFIPAYPRIEAILRRDGTGELTLNGTSRQLTASTVEQLRAGIITRCAATAATLRRPVRVHVSDVEANYNLAIHPDCFVQELAPDGTVQDLDPTAPRYVGAAACRICGDEVPLNLTRCPNCGTSDPHDVSTPASSAESLDEDSAPAIADTGEVATDLLSRWTDAAAMPSATPADAAPVDDAALTPSPSLAPEVELTVLRARSTPPTLIFSTGQVLTVATSVLVGRRPKADASETVAVLFSIEDPDRTVSRTHFRADWREGCLTVTDRGSANGLTSDGGDVLEPGKPVELRNGERITMGDLSFIVQVTS